MSESQPELEPAVAEMLERYTPAPDTTADWPDVLGRSQGARWKTAHAARVLAAASAALLLLIVATPIGGAIRQQVADFSDWLAGTPGTAVSEEEQRAFDEENERSWVAFPGSPELRRLIREERDGVTYNLVGFRSGTSLCLRVVATGEARGKTTMCAPVDELRNDDAPARVLLADWSVGRGEKKETVGFNTYTAPRAQVTAGIVADGVRSLELVDEQGSHRVDAASNAFLYVAERPDVGQRVTHIRAHLDGGETVGVPFAVSPWGPGGGLGGGSGEPGGPAEVERRIVGGGIGWLERREERGEPLDEATLEQGRFGLVAEIEFGRVIAPDTGSSKRIAISVGSFRRLGPGGGLREGLCYHLITRGGTGGTCGSREQLFERGPFTFGYGTIGGGDQFATFSGLASDDVARLELFTATGNQLDVPLRDNAYLVEVALARFPAKLVAYDAEGRVIGIERTFRGEGPARPYGKPIVELEASVPGVGSLGLQAHRTREGGQCWEARGTGDAAVNTGSCQPKAWVEAPLRLALTAAFLYGRAREDIARLELRFEDGKATAIEPGEHGYVLAVIPEPQRRAGHDLVEVVGRSATGGVVARQRMKP